MLQSIAIYLLKTIIVSAVLLLYYWYALRNKRFHYYNRFYLLSAVVLSIALPFLNLNLFTVLSKSDKAISMFNVIYSEGGEDISFAGKAPVFDWQQLLFLAVIAVTIILLVGLALRIFTIYKMKRKYPVTNMQEFDFVNTDLQQAPFSFLKNIFWRNDISMEERTGRLILQHELAHIKEKHTWDKLFMQIVVSVLWANPLYRLYQKELYLIHEFVADDKSVTDSDTTAFAEMLLHAHYGKFNFDPAQPFFYSPIKRRLLMLTTSKEPRFSYVRRMMALPLIALTVLLFAFRLQKENASENVTQLKPGSDFTLVLDAGHGGQDAGAVAADGTKEKDIALSIAKKVKALSSGYGVDVIMTRTEDLYMSPKDKADFSNKQNADAFLSVHVNATDYNNIIKGKGSGMEVLVSKDNTNFESSKLFGSAILQKLSSNFEATENLIQPKTGVWVLKATTTPAILVECGYLTNNKDLSLLKDDAQIELIAKKILEGVVAYANNNNTLVSPHEVKMQEDNAMADTTKQKKVVDVLLEPNGNMTSFNNNDTSIIQNNSITKQKKEVSKDSVLYIVNGKITDKNKLGRLLPGDIMSINVLKGKEATDKYGDKGKNGVVEITTKNSENDKVVQDITLPSFPGGTGALNNYITPEIVNILKAKKAPTGIYTITLSLNVTETGDVTDIKAINDPGYGIPSAVINKIKTGGNWIPAKQNGKNISTVLQQKFSISYTS